MEVLKLSSIWLASLGLASAHAINTPLQFAAPPVVPKEASNIVRHDFASFSWPSHFFSDYAGNASHPNQFTKDVLDLLASKSGAQPFIRVGGTSTFVAYHTDGALSVNVDLETVSGIMRLKQKASSTSTTPTAIPEPSA